MQFGYCISNFDIFAQIYLSHAIMASVYCSELDVPGCDDRHFYYFFYRWIEDNIECVASADILNTLSKKTTRSPPFHDLKSSDAKISDFLKILKVSSTKSPLVVPIPQCPNGEYDMNFRDVCELQLDYLEVNGIDDPWRYLCRDVTLRRLYFDTFTSFKNFIDEKLIR